MELYKNFEKSHCFIAKQGRSSNLNEPTLVLYAYALELNPKYPKSVSYKYDENGNPIYRQIAKINWKDPSHIVKVAEKEAYESVSKDTKAEVEKIFLDFYNEYRK